MNSRSPLVGILIALPLLSCIGCRNLESQPSEVLVESSFSPADIERVAEEGQILGFMKSAAIKEQHRWSAEELEEIALYLDSQSTYNRETAVQLLSHCQLKLRRRVIEIIDEFGPLEPDPNVFRRYLIISKQITGDFTPTLTKSHDRRMKDRTYQELFKSWKGGFDRIISPPD